MEVCAEPAERDDMQTQGRVRARVSGQQRLFVVLLLALAAVLSFVVVRVIDPRGASQAAVACHRTGLSLQREPDSR
jgi:hypothetical protein